MKNFAIISCLFILEACSSLNTINIVKERNPKCQNVAEVEVFQTLNGYALASVCDYKGEQFCMGMTVRVDEITELLYDKKRISAPKGKCIVFSDTYKYETKDGDIKTVPVLGFDYEYEAESEEENITRAVNELQDIKQSCMLYMGKEYKDMAESEKEEKCECVMTEYLTDLQNKTKTTRKALEKKCGKLPKDFI